MTESATSPSRVAVVVPAYNPGQGLVALLEQLAAIVPVEDVIVVDDGSTDGTTQTVRSAGFLCETHPTNCGKGAALSTGLLHARRRGFEWAITMDADGQHSHWDLPKFLHIPRTEDLGIVVGRRAITGTRMPWHRRFSNIVTTNLVSWLAGQPVHDAQSGFRMYNTRLLELSAMPRDGRFEWESRVLVVVSRSGYKIDAVPVATVYGTQSSHIRLFRDTWRFLLMYWRLVWMR